MKSLKDIVVDAERIRDAPAQTNYSHGERRLAGMVADLALRLNDAMELFDAMVDADLAEAGIDMKPAYERMRKMIEEAKANSPAR